MKIISSNLYSPWFKANAIDPATGRIKPHFSYASSLTMIGNLNIRNNKPFRTKREREYAHYLAKRDFDGAYRSSAVKQMNGLRFGIEPPAAFRFLSV